uniref:EGF-like domain-containing protein n=1 Tax=Strongyloides papillosus TaxID=174720 RepID=A0A0N5B8U7_STREA
MTKFIYIHLIFVIHICYLFGLITSDDSFRAEDYRLEYYRNSGDTNFNWKHFNGIKLNHRKFKIGSFNLNKSVIVYKIHLTRDFLIGRSYNSELRISIFNVHDLSIKKDITPNLLPREYNSKNSRFERKEGFLTCNIFKCHIGILYRCLDVVNNCSDSYEAANFFYIAFEKSSEYDNLVMKLITKNNNNTYMFSVVVCPGKTWLPPSSNFEYIPTGENSITKLVSNDSSREYAVKFVYCHETGVKTFTKCGYLKQMFMPQIDVGYQCDVYNEMETSRIHNNYVTESFMIPLSSGELTCNGVDISNSSSFVIGVLPPGNNYNNVSDFKVNVVNNRTNLYSGHRLHSLNVSEVYEHYEEAELYLGYAIHYEAKCKIPSLNATLRLQIDGTVQEFDNKKEKNIGGMNIYKFDRRKIKDAPVGCHAVLDEIKHSALNDYYKLLYSTSLLMFDEAAQKYIKVDDIQKLVSNGKYKCILNMKSNTSEIDKPNYIKETEFTIDLTGEDLKKTADYKKFNKSHIWIIIGVLIFVVLLLIIGFIVFKKLRLKGRKSKKNSSLNLSVSSSLQVSELKPKSPSALSKSISKSTSSSQSAAKFAGVPSAVPNAASNNKIDAGKTLTNMTKATVSKSLYSNSKVSNFGKTEVVNSVHL